VLRRADFVHSLPFPPQYTPAQLERGELNEAAHRFLAAGGDHDVVRRPLLLEHAPLHFHVVAGVAPVAQRIEAPDRCHTQPSQAVQAQAITAAEAVGSHRMKGHGPGGVSQG
jgi:hypothetical protein